MEPCWGIFLHWLLHFLPTKMTFCLWGLVRVEVDHTCTLFRWQRRVRSMMPSSVLVVLYSHFMPVSRTPVEDPDMRNALECSPRSLNSAGQGEEFWFCECTALSSYCYEFLHREHSLRDADASCWMERLFQLAVQEENNSKPSSFMLEGCRTVGGEDCPCELASHTL